MDIVVEVVSWLRATVITFVSDIYNISWFFACIIGFPIIRYFFRKFMSSF